MAEDAETKEVKEEEVKSDFNFTGEVQAGLDFVPLKGGINVAFLKKVTYAPSYTTKKDKTVEQAILDIEFHSLDKERATSFRMFDPTSGSKPKTGKAVQTQIDFMRKRFNNMYICYFGRKPSDDIFTKCKTYADMLKVIANVLNTGGTDNSPIFTTDDGKFMPVHLKVTYFNTNQQLPINAFIEKVREDKETRLTVDPKWDQTEPTKAPTAAAGGSIAGAVDNEFDEEEDLPM